MHSVDTRAVLMRKFRGSQAERGAIASATHPISAELLRRSADPGQATTRLATSDIRRLHAIARSMRHEDVNDLSLIPCPLGGVRAPEHEHRAGELPAAVRDANQLSADQHRDRA